jgi:hypothetical protein
MHFVEASPKLTSNFFSQTALQILQNFVLILLSEHKNSAERQGFFPRCTLSIITLTGFSVLFPQL